MVEKIEDLVDFMQDQSEPQLKNLVNDDEQCLIVGRWIRQWLLQFQ